MDVNQSETQPIKRQSDDTIDITMNGNIDKDGNIDINHQPYIDLKHFQNNGAKANAGFEIRDPHARDGKYLEINSLNYRSVNQGAATQYDPIVNHVLRLTFESSLTPLVPGTNYTYTQIEPH
jgi:hypothetical protein